MSDSAGEPLLLLSLPPHPPLPVLLASWGGGGGAEDSNHWIAKCIHNDKSTKQHTPDKSLND